MFRLQVVSQKYRNELTLNLLRTLKSLVEFGFYGTQQEIQELCDPLISTLDGRADKMDDPKLRYSDGAGGLFSAGSFHRSGRQWGMVRENSKRNNLHRSQWRNQQKRVKVGFESKPTVLGKWPVGNKIMPAGKGKLVTLVKLVTLSLISIFSCL